MNWLWQVWVLCAILTSTVFSSVIELDDSFSEQWKTGTWLVKFYAPWCGYCKRFEPTWNDIGSAMGGSTVQVARLDCTMFKDVAAGFGIRGMPTVKLFHQGRVFEYEGKRDTRPIIDFVQRATGPAVIKVSNLSELSQLMKLKAVIYLLLHDENNSNAMSVYKNIAERHVLNSWFYESSNEDIRKHLQVPTGWGLLVLKDGGFYAYDNAKGLDEDQISLWVLEERFVALSSVELVVTDEHARNEKLIVLLSLPANYANVPVLGKSHTAVYSTAKSRRYHPAFYFAFSSDDYVIQRVTMGAVSRPCLVVVNFTTHQFYPLSKDLATVSAEESDVTELLDQIREGKATPMGGKTWYYTVYSFLWEVTAVMKGMWTTQPVLVAVMGSLIVLLVGVLIFVICSSFEPEPEPRLSPVHDKPPKSVEMPPAEDIKEDQSDTEETEAEQGKRTSTDTKTGKQKED